MSVLKKTIAIAISAASIFAAGAAITAANAANTTIADLEKQAADYKNTTAIGNKSVESIVKKDVVVDTAILDLRSNNGETYAVVTGYNNYLGDNGTLRIPAQVTVDGQNYLVKRVGDGEGIFAGYTNNNNVVRSQQVMQYLQKVDFCTTGNGDHVGCSLEIAPQAFRGLNSIKEIDLGAINVGRIDYLAFAYTQNVNKVNFADKATSVIIQNGAFYQCGSNSAKRDLALDKSYMWQNSGDLVWYDSMFANVRIK